MDIVYITPQEQSKSDVVLSEVASCLAASGFQLAGIVQTNSDRADCHGCDMDVLVLPDGPTIRISQSLGREARGCKLDPAALEEAVAEVQQRLTEDADFLVLNKFGRHEAEGRGFRNLVAEALSLGVPVLTAVNQLNRDAFLEFTGGLATELPPETGAILEWATALSEKRKAAA